MLFSSYCRLLWILLCKLRLAEFPLCVEYKYFSPLKHSGYCVTYKKLYILPHHVFFVFDPQNGNYVPEH
jgi:hypothetical protein